MLPQEKPYFQQRIDELGITDFENLLSVFVPEEEEPQMKHLLSGGEDGNLKILYLDLKKKDDAYVAMTYETEVTSGISGHVSVVQVPYHNIRLRKPLGKMKYKLPHGAPAYPFLPPALIDAYQAKQHIPILIMTEGSLKALKGTLHGAFAIGINGIWGMRDKGSNDLHPIVKKIIEACKVQHVVYLHDADFREVKYEYLKDVGERPFNFANTVIKYQKAVRRFKNPSIKFYYAHTLEGGPKGLDDVLIANKGHEAEVVADLLQFQQANKFFEVFNVLEDFKNLADVKKYFYIDSPENFYAHHSATLDDHEFIFQGDYYKYDSDEEIVNMTLPKEVNDFVLVGNRYYKNVYELNSKNNPERVRSIRNMEIILDDFRRMNKDEKEARNLMLKIPKYDGYVNHPNFQNFQQEYIIHNRFRMLNLAYPLEHRPEPGEWPHIESFLQHIFHNGGDSKYEVGLDMIQMYYTQPTQIQRILCLTSQSNETGKTKFLELMRAIFGQNMSIIGAADFESQFNPYIVKSLVGVDESKIEDLRIIEMIKSMVTNPYAMLNDKGVAAQQVVNRVKLIMTTNHVNNFAAIKEEENKWFVLEVGQVQKKDKDLMEKMEAEIPAFLHFLVNRELVHYTNESRFAIPDDVVETEALKRVKHNSRPQLVVMIENYLKNRFDEFGEGVIKIDATRLLEQLFPERNNKIGTYEILRTLKNDFKMDPSPKSEYFKVPVQTVMVDEIVEEGTGEVTPAVIQIKWQGYTGKVYTFEPAGFG